MTTIAQVQTALQRLLLAEATTATALCGCVQRVRKFTGATLIQTLVLGWLSEPAATLSQLCQMAAAVGVAISPQGLAQRFTPAAAQALARMLAQALTEAIGSGPLLVPLLARFAAIYVQDSTTITLPAALATLWRGCGGTPGHATAALKLQVGLDLLHGTLRGLRLAAGRRADQPLALTPAEVGPGSLVVQDLGYFTLDGLAAYSAAGIGWLSRLKVNTTLWVDDQRTSLGEWLSRTGDATLDVPVELGSHQHLPARLLAVRVPPAVAAERRRRLHAAAHDHGRCVSAARLAVADWTVLVTNLPPARLTLAEALALYRARWQVELLFKLWKQHGGLDRWRSAQPWRILCEVYAKLLGLLLQHWLTLTGAWADPRHSLVRAAAVVRQHALALATALTDRRRLRQALTTLARCLAHAGRIATRRTRPATHQLLADPTLALLA